MTPLGNTGSSFTYQRLVTIVTELVKIALQIGEVVAVGAIVYFGLRMVISRGDETKFSEAKKGLQFAVLGALIIFGVYTIIATVQRAVESVGN
jgi:hypothetical protein